MNSHPSKAGEASLLGDVLRRARDGDESARERLFAMCRNYVQLVARGQMESCLKGKVDASDLVQETMMDACRGWEAFRGETTGEWLAWLKQIACRNALDAQRRYLSDKRRANREVSMVSVVDGSFAQFEPPADTDSPSRHLARQESELMLADAIAALPEDYQQVLICRSLLHLPFSEVAERMDRSRPAVQMLWARALKQLQKSLVKVGECDEFDN